MDSDADTLTGGLPHSEIPGSTIARISPGLFAACHVLHRLSVPRHPPDALDLRLSATPNGKDHPDIRNQISVIRTTDAANFSFSEDTTGHTRTASRPHPVRGRRNHGFACRGGGTCIPPDPATVTQLASLRWSSTTHPGLPKGA